MQLDLSATEVTLLTDLLQRWEDTLQCELAAEATAQPQASLLLSVLSDLRQKLSCAQWSASTCSYCGIQFVGADPDARFCCDRCRRRFDRLATRAIRNITAS